MTIFIISSKSFTTDETIQMLKSAIDWSPSLNNFIVITSNVKEANKYGFNNKNIVSFDKEIGGRYSIWSPIAQIPLLEKNSYELFINGGNFADQELINNKEYLRFIKQLSFTDIWLHNNKNKSIRVVLSYIWSLRSFANYVQQLEMESLGKHANSTLNTQKLVKLFLEVTVLLHNTIFSITSSGHWRHLCRYHFKQGRSKKLILCPIYSSIKAIIIWC